MRKKGFSLLELLAVILVLGVIALIAIPTVTGIINDSNKQAFKISVQEVALAVEQQCQTQKMKGLSLTDNYTFTSDGSSETINVKGTLPSGGSINVDSNCNTEFAVSNNKYCVKKSFDEEKVKIEKLENGKCTLEVVVPLCKRATTLHTEKCEYTNINYCNAAGYTVSGSKGTTTITYGNLGTTGILETGDAFDCDVNGDGVYDSSTERFYYVSDYYNTFTRKFESDNAVLVYYNNVELGVPNNTETGTIEYYEYSKNNIYGPETAVIGLPLIKQWPNVKLINNTRKILPEVFYATYTDSVSIDYSLYSARLLTSQEIETACEVVFGEETEKLPQTCVYLLENTKFSSNAKGSYGFWLETYDSAGDYGAWVIDVSSDYIDVDGTYYSTGLRPVIEIPKGRLEY